MQGTLASAAFGLIVLHTASAAAQLSSRRFGKVIPTFSGIPTLVAGTPLIVVSTRVADETLALIGTALTGLGRGIAYRSYLAVLSKGLASNDQGSVASFYSATTTP